jgi:hypothetical protein
MSKRAKLGKTYIFVKRVSQAKVCLTGSLLIELQIELVAALPESTDKTLLVTILLTL